LQNIHIAKYPYFAGFAEDTQVIQGELASTVYDILEIPGGFQLVPHLIVDPGNMEITNVSGMLSCSMVEKAVPADNFN
jgi:hypothetical protein